MPMRHAIDVDRIQRALARWCTSSLAGESVELRWADQPAPRAGTRRWVLLNLAVAPAPRQIDHGDRLVVRPTAIRFVIAPTFSAGQRFRLLVNRYPFDHTAAAANSPAAVATALAALVLDGPEPVTATAGPGLGELTVARAQAGDLTSAALLPAGLVADGPDVVDTEDVFESGGSRVATCSVTCFSPSAVGPLSADQLAADLVTHLAEKPVRRALRNDGVSVWSATQPRAVSTLQGTEIERAIAFDLRLGLRARLARAGTSIDVVEVLRTAGGITRTITIPQP